MSKRYLVTGGSGFIGAHIIKSLMERGDQVVSLDVREPENESAWLLNRCSGKLNFEKGSIEDWARVIEVIEKVRPNGIVHIAAIVNPVLLNSNPRLALRVNLEGVYNILEAARIFKLGRVVHFSSIGVLPTFQYQPIDVNHPVFLATEGPCTNFYGASKIAEEAFCWAYRQSFRIDCITLRPSAVYGLGMQWPMYIKPMVENSLQGKPSVFESGRDFPRDYTHVSDVAQITLQALDVPSEKIRDRVYFVATGKPLVTAGQVAEIVKEFIPTAQIEIGPGISKNDELEIRYRGILDIRNAQEQLGYQPRYADIRDGIKEYINAYRAYMGI